MDNDTAWRLTYEDFETVLDRKLTQDEKDLIYNKFSIDDWYDIVECFFDVHGISRKKKYKA